jgi:small-conductance mechanosensitive channel
MTSLGQIISDIVSKSLSGLAVYFPQFVGGLIVLIIGLIVAAILHRIVVEFFRLVKVEKWFVQAKISKPGEVKVWADIFAELVRWSTIILFLVPAVEAWGVPRVTDVLNPLLLYLPNVFVAVIIGLIGMVIANLAFDVVRQAAKNLGASSANALGGVARYAILFFTGLIVLNQLGVAAALVQTLFTGIVAMVALAGGLAFGLGGQEVARDILKGIKEKLEK